MMSLVASLALATSPAGATDARITAGEVTLAATLHMPDAAPPVPGIVLVHGSGLGTRAGLAEQAEALNGLGLAVLSYDKRGTGSSTGDWRVSSLEDLAADASAALTWLASQPGIDGRRSGYWGVSQAGWVLPVAAARSSPAFLVVVTGGGLDPEAVERHQYLAKLHHSGAEGSVLAEAEALLDLYFAYLADGSGHDRLMSEVRRHESTPWFGSLGIDRVIPVPQNRPAWAWVANLDAAAQVRALAVPTLVLLGGKDPLMPLERTHQAWTANLRPGAGNCVIVVPHAGHGLRTGAHGGPLAPEFARLIGEWLDDRGVTAQRSKVAIQLGSQDLPPSTENACSRRKEVDVMSENRNRT